MRRTLLTLAGLIGVGLLVACGGGGKSSNGFVGRAATVSFSDVCQKSDLKQFTQPDKVIDPKKTYIATIKTAKGDIVMELDTKTTPITTNSFVFLACKGFYDGLTFHRVLPGFAAQAGDSDPRMLGYGGPGYTIPGEFDSSKFVTGVVGLARAGDPDSGGSQFFIMLGESSGLNGAYTEFGKVTSGMDVVQALTPRDPSTNPNAPPGDAIETVTIQEK